jgi:hypothetical protein
VNLLPALGALASVLACVLAWELLPAADDGADIAPPRPEPVQARAAADANIYPLNDIAGTLLGRPLFSPERRPAPPESSPAGAAEDIPRLTGIIIGPDGARAIFDDGSGRLKVAAQGDMLGRFKIGTIGFGQVSLIASEGERVLRPRFAGSAQASGALAVAGAGTGPVK